MTPGWELGGRSLACSVCGSVGKEGALAPVLCGWVAFPGEVVTLQHNYSRSPVSCAAVHTAGTINSTYPQQAGTYTKDIMKMNRFSRSFHILLLITGTFSVGKCSYKASDSTRRVKLHSHANKWLCTWDVSVQIMQLPSAATPAIHTALAINIYLYYSIERKHVKETNDFASFSIHTAIRSVSFGSLPPSISCSQAEDLQTRCCTAIKY